MATVLAFRILTVASTGKNSTATSVQASPRPAVQSQSTDKMRPSLASIIQGLSGLAGSL